VDQSERCRFIKCSSPHFLLKRLRRALDPASVSGSAATREALPFYSAVRAGTAI
jgi:hypothetical protein